LAAVGRPQDGAAVAHADTVSPVEEPRLFAGHERGIEPGPARAAVPSPQQRALGSHKPLLRRYEEGLPHGPAKYAEWLPRSSTIIRGVEATVEGAEPPVLVIQEEEAPRAFARRQPARLVVGRRGQQGPLPAAVRRLEELLL